MPKLPFRRSSQKSHNFAAVEITSGYVQCVVFDVSSFEEGVYTIVGASHVPLELGYVRAGLIVDIENTAFAVKGAVLDAAKDLPKFSGNVVLAIAGELSIGNITTVKSSHLPDKPIKKKDIDHIYKTVGQVSLENAATSFLKSTGNIDIPMELIFSNDVYYKLDGSIVSDIIDKTASEIEVAVFSSYTPAFNVGIYEKLMKKTGFKLVGISSELFSLSLALKKLKGQFFDGVLIHIGSDFTEIGVVFGGGLVSTKSMSIGTDHFANVVASQASLSHKEASFKLHKYFRAELEQDEALLMQGMTSEILELWLDGIQILFEDFEGVKTYSSKIYIVGALVELPGLLDMLTKEPWTKSIPFKSPPEYSKVLTEDFHFIKDETGKCSGVEFTSLISTVESYLFLSGMVN